MITYNGLLEKMAVRGVKYKLRQAKVSPGILDKIEKGTGGLDARTLDKICAVLDCQPGDLMEYVAEEPEA